MCIRDGAYAEKVRDQLARIPSLRDLQFAQSLDYPSVEVRVDRERAGLSRVTVEDVSRSLVEATSSSRFVVPIFWADPKTGIGYYVQVQVPPYEMNSVAEVGMESIKGQTDKQLLVRDVAQVRESKEPGEYDRYNMRRLLSMTANIEGEDLGRVIGHLNRALEAAGAPPRGAKVDVRGQVVPMQEMFGALGEGGRSVALEDRSQLPSISCLLRAQGRDDRPTVRNDLHETLSLKLPQGFANQRSADPGSLTELALDQPLAGITAAARGLLVEAAELALADITVVALQLLLGHQLGAEVGRLLAPLPVLAGAVVAPVQGALRAAPEIDAEAPVYLVFRSCSLAHRPLIRLVIVFVPIGPAARAGRGVEAHILGNEARHYIGRTAPVKP